MAKQETLQAHNLLEEQKKAQKKFLTYQADRLLEAGFDWKFSDEYTSGNPDVVNRGFAFDFNRVGDIYVLTPDAEILQLRRGHGLFGVITADQIMGASTRVLPKLEEEVDKTVRALSKRERSQAVPAQA